MSDNDLRQRKDPSSGVDFRHGSSIRSNSITGSNSENISNSLTVAAILSGATTADFRSSIEDERENASQELSL
ncbi:MAG: hypothetical protein PQ612_01875 [Rickettsiales bacterium]|nr:hypothetical protein [Pseudomonadota bacterium]MDA0967126.1 hypothetical protein [Pseudomonadota bacterium]MDG4542388.1 hypothetical protein [Rickettsiales bacterium]MDG4544892.1 hypothetical protein [Rickettsiales bacterium]MDG4547015.1 hypothetical protein [Rickettsiales bacterium]